MPKGSIWSPSADGDFDKLQDGVADCAEFTRSDLDDLSEVRNPLTTAVLNDLEMEYGVTTQTNITEGVRRTSLKARKYPKIRNGSVDHLQNKLDAAGFNLTVYENSPAVDPAIFLDQAFQIVLGAANAYLGGVASFLGRTGGELLVNGDIVENVPIYTSTLGGALAYLGGAASSLGAFSGVSHAVFEYDMPTDPNDWPLVFFVGGAATFGGSGELLTIESGEVPAERKAEFKKTILRIKPMHSWAGQIITYT